MPCSCSREESPDFVCLDIMMPGTSGYDVCREIRRARSDVPVIFISAKSEEIDTVIGLELGADDFIVKPFGVKEVVARIGAVTRRRFATAKAARRSPRLSNLVTSTYFRPNFGRDGAGQRSNSACGISRSSRSSTKTGEPSSRVTRSSTGAGGWITCPTAERWTNTSPSCASASRWTRRIRHRPHGSRCGLSLRRVKL